MYTLLYLFALLSVCPFCKGHTGDDAAVVVQSSQDEEVIKLNAFQRVCALPKVSVNAVLQRFHELNYRYASENIDFLASTLNRLGGGECLMRREHMPLWGNLAKSFPEKMLDFCFALSKQKVSECIDKEAYLTYLARVVNSWDQSLLNNKESFIQQAVGVYAATALDDITQRDVSSPLCVAAYLNGYLGQALTSSQLVSWLWEAMDDARFLLEQKMKEWQCEQQSLFNFIGVLTNAESQDVQNRGQALHLIAQRLPHSEVESVISRFQQEKVVRFNPIAVNDVCQSLRVMLQRNRVIE